jgi:hypothetical protein
MYSNEEKFMMNIHNQLKACLRSRLIEIVVKSSFENLVQRFFTTIAMVIEGCIGSVSGFLIDPQVFMLSPKDAFRVDDLS